MCSITGSFDKQKLKELRELNAYRGEQSYSLCTFRAYDSECAIQVLFQDYGKMPDSLNTFLPLPNNDYIVSHLQAPTTQTPNLHPAANKGALLWHNGIVKQHAMPQGMWDTLWLLDLIVMNDWNILSTVTGSFACMLFMKHNLYVFRNEISPLFIDDDLNVSSTKFNGSRSLEPNTVFLMDLSRRILQPTATFKTNENPYFFG